MGWGANAMMVIILQYINVYEVINLLYLHEVEAGSPWPVGYTHQVFSLFNLKLEGMRKAGSLPSSSMVRYHIPCLEIMSPVEGCIFLATPAQSRTSNKQNFKCHRLSLFWVLTDYLEELLIYCMLLEQLPQTLHGWFLSLFIGFVYSCHGEQVHRAPHTAILETELLFTFTVRIPEFVQSDPILLPRVKRLRVEHLTQDGPQPLTRKLLLKLGVYSSEQWEENTREPWRMKRPGKDSLSS